MATLVPCGTFKLKCSSTYSSPSGYLKVTSLNSISPCNSSQFSFLGLNISPYFSTTSLLSATSDSVAISPVNLSIFTEDAIRSAKVRVMFLIGSIIPCTYDINTDRVPISITPLMVSTLACISTMAMISEPTSETREVESAEK